MTTEAYNGPIRDAMIRRYLGGLERSFNKPRPPVDLRPFRKLHADRNFVEMVRQVRNIFNLKIDLRIGYVNSGGDLNAPAWVTLPNGMPMFGTKEFSELRVNLFLRKDFLSIASPEEIINTISHEMSHIVLESLGHELKQFEEAVDLTAMFFGFSESYTIAAIHSYGKARRYGYLSPYEIEYAAKKMHKKCGTYRFLVKERFKADRGKYIIGAVIFLLLIVNIASAIISPNMTKTEPNSVLPHSNIDTYCSQLRNTIDSRRSTVDDTNSYEVSSLNQLVDKFNSDCAGRVQ